MKKQIKVKRTMSPSPRSKQLLLHFLSLHNIFNYNFSFRKRNRNRKNSVKVEQSTVNGTVEETTLPSTISIQVSL